MRKLRTAVLWSSLSLVVALVAGVLFLGTNEAGAKTFEQTAGDAAAGKTIFLARCTSCHLNGGQDAGGRGPQLAGKTRTTEFVSTRVRNGLQGAMPAFGPAAISDADLPNVVAYVLSLGPAAAPAAPAAPAPAPATVAAPSIPAAGVGYASADSFNLLWLLIPLTLTAAGAGLFIQLKNSGRSRL